MQNVVLNHLIGRWVRADKVRASLLGCAALICLGGIPTAGHAQGITQLFSFPCPAQQFGVCSDGYAPDVLIQASDGDFYGAAGLTTMGTSNPQGGTLFKITPKGQFTLLYTFAADVSGHYVNGDQPATALVEGNDGFVYGATFTGGANNSGVLFRISKTGTGFKVVHNFCSAIHCADGNVPLSLTLGHDGNLYGVTSQGGSNDRGTIFRFTPPGTFTTLFEFGSTAVGGGPSGLIQGLDGNFYGVAGSSIFRFTSSGQFTVLKSLPPVQGFLPTFTDSGLVQASNGNLYGALTTYSMDQAQFYEISPSGKGFQEFPAIGRLAVDFGIGSVIQASDGNLWTAFNQVSCNSGCVIAMSPGSGAVVQNHPFLGTDGSVPEAGVIQGADGKIYGTATGGGTVAPGKAASGTVWALDVGLPPPRPAVAAFTPASGAVGSNVTIRGHSFIGTTAVTFNGVSARFRVLNTNFIIATVPAGATTGPIEVTNAGGTITTKQQFTVE